MNLKQAAARLGIHYQTAYKLVRSGALVAVRVGGTYEISEAAIERYLTERAAQRADPVARRAASTVPEPPIGDERSRLLEAVVRSVSNATLSAQGVFDTTALGAAEVLGDLCVLMLVGPQGDLHPASYRHRDPARLGALAAMVEASQMRADRGLAADVMSSGEALFLPHVPQDRLRAFMPPEFLQYLDEIGVYSVIMVPVRHGGRSLGILAVARDLPGRPFTRDDLALVHELARLIGVAIRRVERFRQGWERRGVLVDAVEAAVAEASGLDDLTPLLSDGPLFEAIFDPEGRLVALNDAGRAFAGTLPQGTEPLELVDPAEREAEATLLRRLLRGELSFHDAERTARNVTGEPVRLVVHRGVARAANAEPQALIVVAHPAIPLGAHLDLTADSHHRAVAR